MKLTKIKDTIGISSIVLELSEEEAEHIQWMAHYVDDNAWKDCHLDAEGQLADEDHRATAKHVAFLKMNL